MTPAARASSAAARRLSSGRATSRNVALLEGRMAGLGRLGGGIEEPRRCGWRQRQVVAGDHGAGVSERGRVRHGGAGGDHRRVVARHVRDRQRPQSGRVGRRRQPAAGDRRQVLAQRVHRADVGAGCQQRGIDRLEVGERQAGGGQRQQRRAAARHQRHHQIVRAEAGDQFQDAPGGVGTGRVRHRVGGLDDLDPPAGHGVAVAGHHQPVERVWPGRLECAGHGRRRLAGADHDGAPEGLRRQMVDHPVGRGAGDRRLGEPAEEGARVSERHGGAGESARESIREPPAPSDSGDSTILAQGADRVESESERQGVESELEPQVADSES